MSLRSTSTRSRILLMLGSILFALLLGLTALGLDTPFNRMQFSGTSGEYMMIIVSGSALVQTLLLFGIGYGLYHVGQRPTLRAATLFVAVALVWVLSGRKVGVLRWPEGRVYVGWFSIRTEQFSLCVPTEDCEATTLHTIVTPLPFWRVRLANAHSQRIVFIGPVTWDPTLRMLRQAFGPPSKK
jgi:hypothetical protein